MSRTQNVAELCAILVDETYGELASRIFTPLLRRGRLTIPDLAHYTRLPTRHLRHGLAVLMQQNLIFYYFDSDSRMTHYEANQDAAYFLLRSGKILELFNSRFGTLARDVAQRILFLGHANIHEIAKEHESRRVPGDSHFNWNGMLKPAGNGVPNGTNEHIEDFRIDDVENILVRLLEAGFVEPVAQHMFQSPSDIYNQVEKEFSKDKSATNLKGPKQKDEMNIKIIERLREIRSEGQLWHRKGVKRSLNGDHYHGSEKRRKLANGDNSVNGGFHAHLSGRNNLDHDLIVRVNYEKCMVALRNRELVALVANEVGKTASHIYAALLRLMEKNIQRCHLDPLIEDPSGASVETGVTTAELDKDLGENINPAIGIGVKRDTKKEQNRSTAKKSPKRLKRHHDDSEVAVVGDASSDEDGEGRADGSDINEHGNIPEVEQDSDSHGEDPFEEPLTKVPIIKASLRAPKVTFQEKLPKPMSRDEKHNRLLQIRKHLLVLEEHSRHFVRECGSPGSGEWTINFEHVVNSMRETALDTIADQSFGKIGKRVTQILRQKGKLDEKQIQKLGLLRLKDVRTKLAEMQMASFVDVQEVPRDHTRSALKSMHFWFYDPERVKRIVLDRIYKTMSRSLQALEAEKKEEIQVLSTSERTDVKGHEEDILQGEFLERLRKIREKEERVLTQIGRLDDLVAIFQDF